MTDITLNHLNQTYNQVYPFGILTDTQRTVSDAICKNNSLLNTAYHVLANTSSYSSLINSFVGEYFHSAAKFEQPWLTYELKDFLRHSSHISLSSLEYLLSEIYVIFGNVKIEAVIHTDPEEGWTKPIFTVHSEIEDLDELMKREDEFFIRVDKDSKLLSILPHVIVSQA